MENAELYKIFKQTLPSQKAIANAMAIAGEVRQIIAGESDCIIHGDWKPENTTLGKIYDFSDVRKFGIRSKRCNQEHNFC